MTPEEELEKRVEMQARRMKKAERERSSVLAHVMQLGTLGLVFVLPVVAGAYLGRWLDERLAGYSVSWTVSMILLGVFVGGLNVFLAIRRSD